VSGYWRTLACVCLSCLLQELLTVIWFTLEFVVRVWSAGCRSRYRGLAGRVQFIRRPLCIVGAWGTHRERVAKTLPGDKDGVCGTERDSGTEPRWRSGSKVSRSLRQYNRTKTITVFFLLMQFCCRLTYTGLEEHDWVKNKCKSKRSQQTATERNFNNVSWPHIVTDSCCLVQHPCSPWLCHVTMTQSLSSGKQLL